MTHHHTNRTFLSSTHRTLLLGRYIPCRSVDAALRPVLSCPCEDTGAVPVVRAACVFRSSPTVPPGEGMSVGGAPGQVVLCADLGPRAPLVPFEQGLPQNPWYNVASASG